MGQRIWGELCRCDNFVSSFLVHLRKLLLQLRYGNTAIWLQCSKEYWTSRVQVYLSMFLYAWDTALHTNLHQYEPKWSIVIVSIQKDWQVILTWYTNISTIFKPSSENTRQKPIIVRSIGMPISTHSPTYINISNQIKKSMWINNLMQGNRWSTAGKPRSKSPKPTKHITGDMLRGLKNLLVELDSS